MTVPCGIETLAKRNTPVMKGAEYPVYCPQITYSLV